MTGITDLDIAKSLVRLINLVAFDACNVNSLRLVQDVNPLNYVIVCPLQDSIPKELHSKLRKALKGQAKKSNVLLGRISLVGEIRINVYKKVLRSPAYIHGESPQDNDS